MGGGLEGGRDKYTQALPAGRWVSVCQHVASKQQAQILRTYHTITYLYYTRTQKVGHVGRDEARQHKMDHSPLHPAHGDGALDTAALCSRYKRPSSGLAWRGGARERQGEGVCSLCLTSTTSSRVQTIQIALLPRTYPVVNSMPISTEKNDVRAHALVVYKSKGL